MSVVYLVDGYPPKPYDARTLATEPTGGTMADVIILAETLATRGHQVYVLQLDPPKDSSGKAQYVSTRPGSRLPPPDAVIYVRGHFLIEGGHLSPPEVRERSPSCRFVYWPHVTYPQPFATWWGDLYGVWGSRKQKRLGQLLGQHQVKVVGVSAYHAETLRAAWRRLSVEWIYNPVEDVSAEFSDITYSNDRILYASSPERGLRRAIDIVARVRRERRDTRLYVATPGYPAAQRFLSAARRGYKDVAIELGHLRRPELFTQMKRSLCVLQPNTSFRESFGRVYAEAHVVGTPVLTSRLGAAPETVGDAAQFLDPRDTKAAARRILEWADGERPMVRANPAFGPHAVAERWEVLMCLSAASPTGRIQNVIRP
jgi:glycosyltransferase involved in cell wall biosynthesis